MDASSTLFALLLGVAAVSPSPLSPIAVPNCQGCFNHSSKSPPGLPKLNMDYLSVQCLVSRSLWGCALVGGVGITATWDRREICAEGGHLTMGLGCQWVASNRQLAGAEASSAVAIVHLVWAAPCARNHSLDNQDPSPAAVSFGMCCCWCVLLLV